MSRTKMQSYNLLLVTIAILMGVAVTVVAIIWIWTESSFSELAGRLVGSASILAAACLLNIAVNSVLGRKVGRLFPSVCYTLVLVTVYAGVILSLLAIWAVASGEVIWKSIGTLAVLFFASLIGLAFSAVASATTSTPAPPRETND
jgi:hypothetical protein